MVNVYCIDYMKFLQEDKQISQIQSSKEMKNDDKDIPKKCREK